MSANLNILVDEWVDSNASSILSDYDPHHAGELTEEIKKCLITLKSEQSAHQINASIESTKQRAERYSAQAIKSILLAQTEWGIYRLLSELQTIVVNDKIAGIRYMVDNKQKRLDDNEKLRAEKEVRDAQASESLQKRRDRLRQEIRQLQLRNSPR